MITSLHIDSFRKIQNLDIDCFGRASLIVGKNLCGKSSLLSAIGYASRRVTHKAVDCYPSIRAKHAPGNSAYPLLCEKNRINIAIEFLSLLRGHDLCITNDMDLKAIHKQVFYCGVRSSAKQLMSIACGLCDNLGGAVLLDDMEYNLHHSLMSDVWRLILSLSVELNIQVFASTHSLDILKSFALISREMNFMDGAVYHLGTSVNNGDTLTTRYDVLRVNELLDVGCDVR